MVMVGTVMTGRWASFFFQIVVFPFALGEAEPPAVIVDRDRDMIGIVECFRAAIEGGVVKLPLRRRELPDQLREVVTVFVITFAAALGREIELIPPLQLGF